MKTPLQLEHNSRSCDKTNARDQTGLGPGPDSRQTIGGDGVKLPAQQSLILRCPLAEKKTLRGSQRMHIDRDGTLHSRMKTYIWTYGCNVKYLENLENPNKK